VIVEAVNTPIAERGGVVVQRLPDDRDERLLAEVVRGPTPSLLALWPLQESIHVVRIKHAASRLVAADFHRAEEVYHHHP